MDRAERFQLVQDFVRALGYDPNRVGEVRLTPDHVTITYWDDAEPFIGTAAGGRALRLTTVQLPIGRSRG